jgi:hypothetical protein
MNPDHENRVTRDGVPGFGPRRRRLASPLLAATTALAPQGTSGRS